MEPTIKSLKFESHPEPITINMAAEGVAGSGHEASWQPHRFTSSPESCHGPTVRPFGWIDPVGFTLNRIEYELTAQFNATFWRSPLRSGFAWNGGATVRRATPGGAPATQQGTAYGWKIVREIEGWAKLNKPLLCEAAYRWAAFSCKVQATIMREGAAKWDRMAVAIMAGEQEYNICGESE